MKCAICKRIKMWKNENNPYFIHEFKYSIFVVGDHQFYKGYSLLLFKEHERDITDLPLDIQKEFFEEVMIAGKTLQKLYQPYRLNYSCLGNFVEHVHFHIFPRYEEDLKDEKTKNPWWNSDSFVDKKIDNIEAIRLAKEIRDTLV
jgi:diadenosine tetraphosphate (Ap4A) HIT family hydrolase